MKASEEFAKLSDRARQAESKVLGASSKTREELSHQVEDARKAADDLAEQVRKGTSEAVEKASEIWSEARANWSGTVERLRSELSDRVDEADADRLRRRADRAERDAEAAVVIAAAALQEAEYAVLDAALAKAEAEDAASGT